MAEAHPQHDASDGRALGASWLRHARSPQVRGALEAVFADIAAEISRRAPACWASGRCCNFERAGHRLYVTGLEAAYTVTGLDAGTPLTRAGLDAALARGGCPFQAQNLCGVHTIKPVACRVYFCDRSAQGWQRELSERMHERVRALHDTLGVEYRYAEWRWLLGVLLEGGGRGGGSGPDRPAREAS